MKNIQYYNASKYADTQYEKREHGIFKMDGEFYVSLSFIQEPELDEGSDSTYISQYPLEDVLDKFLVYVSDFYDAENEKGQDVCVLEFASSNEEHIVKLLSIIGKHVYNKIVMEDGEEAVTLIIE